MNDASGGTNWNAERAPNWTGTNTGKRINLRDPDPEQIIIEDIATGLGNTCRFGGQIKHWFSVAEHCIKVAGMVPPEHRLIALLHDAAEAYLCDIPTPLKRELGGAYTEIEDRVALAIGCKFGLGDTLVHLPECVMTADRAVLMAERDALQANPQVWSPAYEMSLRYPSFRIDYPTPLDARDAYLRRYSDLKVAVPRRAA